MELRKDPKKNSSRGVALLLTLSMIVILSMALAKVYEERSVEVAHLGNSLSRTRVELLARSVFRAILSTIKDQGLTAVNYSLTQIPDHAPIPFDDGLFTKPVITSVDSNFLLNSRAFKAGTPEAQIFANLIDNILAEERGNNDLSTLQTDVEPLLSAINDWIDEDIIPDEQFFYGGETYPTEEPSFMVKNRLFDALSEIKLLPEFRNKNISMRSLRRYFRIVGNLSAPVRIDINISSEAEILKFLERFKDVEAYRKVYDNKEDLAEIAKRDITEPFLPKYKSATGRNSAWVEDLKANGIELSGNELDLFTEKSEYLSISYTVRLAKAAYNVYSLVKLSYAPSKDFYTITRIKILQFTLR